MADDQEVGEKKPSTLRTLLWGAAALGAAFLIPGGGLMTLVKIGAVAFAGLKAWGSHKENQQIEAENAALGQSPGSGITRQQERALAIAQMQDQDGVAGTRWQDAEAARRAYSQNVR